MEAPDTLQPVMLVLFWTGLLLLLGSTVGALAVCWRLLGQNDRLRVKLDWLRTSNNQLAQTVASYESATPPDRKRTTLMPVGMAGALSAKPKA
jgi:hypothetical protein